MDLSDRDLAALRFIGEGYEVAQYQLHEAIFRERAATVVSRFVVRAQEQKLIVPLRQNRIGINRLRRCGAAPPRTGGGKTNRFGSKYVYYHCTRRRGSDRCAEPFIELRTLEAQMHDFIESVTLSPKRHAWGLRVGKRGAAEIQQTLHLQRAGLEQARAQNEMAQKNLRYLRTREQILEAEFLSDREELLREQSRLDQELARLSPENVIEPERAVVLLNVRALRWFEDGDGGARRLVLEAMGSNPMLAGGNLKIDVRFPFRRYDRKDETRQLCPGWESNPHEVALEGF
jgi:hypothetical protein